MKEIQGQIASMLGLSLSETSVAERACHIYERLKGKKVLIILDDLWKELDLKKIGIPFGIEHLGCKILFTSRFLQVLSSMGTEKEFLLGALNEEEAWTLFEEKIIDIVRKPAFLTIGKEVAKRCAGLPVLIVTVAASLSKQRHLSVWKDALTQLKKMNNKQMHDIVNSTMKTISYSHLKQRHKQLFLLCGLMGGDASIERLLHYSLGWDLFDGEVSTMGEARNRLHALILDLKESCLLLDGFSRDFIKMHDVVKEVAISIAKNDLNMFMMGDNDAELNIWHKDDALKRCAALVFHDCPNLSSLPQQLECPSLELCDLSGFSQNSLVTIPNTFFEKTINLQVLDMSRLHFSTLPSSLSFLKNLQTLRLSGCYNLKDISVIEELEKLQILSFSGSGIEELPCGIGKLSELRLLDMRRCSKLKLIPAGLIKGLSQLEELYIGHVFNGWEADVCINGSVKTNASLLELKHLAKLSCLEVTVSDAQLLSEDINFEKLERYEIIVGEFQGFWEICWWLFGAEITRNVLMKLSGESITRLQHGYNKLFKRTEGLCLLESKGIKNIIPELDGDGFLDLKYLCIQKDYEIKYIINIEEEQHKTTFPSLESLDLSHLLTLQKICNGRLMEEAFGSLTTLNVRHCNKLESLFSFSMAIGLRCLKAITVSNCDVLENIVGEKSREDIDANIKDGVCAKIEFAQLRTLSLYCLPKLKTFLSNDDMPPIHKESQSSLRTVESEEIHEEEEQFKSSMPFLEQVSFPKLEGLILSGISNLTEIWSQKLRGISCCNLTGLTVENCDNLKYLLTPSISMGLVGLQRLIIRNCMRMKTIVENEVETKTETICFPQLNYLHLGNLPDLTAFYSGSVEEMYRNENLDTVIQPLFSEKVKFPCLEELVIKNLDTISIIWQNQHLYQVDSISKLKKFKISSCASLLKIYSSTMSTRTQIDSREPGESLVFQNLSEVSVNKCESLRHVFPANVARSLNQLKELSIEDCGVETIMGDDKDSELEEIKAIEAATTFTFPKLVKFNLKRLSKLKCFYPREHTTEWPILEEVEVCDCDKIQPSIFSIGKVAFPPPVSFKNLLDLNIYRCVGLKYLFTPSIAMNLEKVKEITIRKCSMMKAIVGNEEGEAATYMIAFPQLIHLCLEDLPNLTRFYSGIEEMDSNEKLDSEAHPLFNEKITFSSLEELEIARLDNISSIWQNQHLYQVDSFSKLKKFKISSCASLLKIYSSTMSTRTHIDSRETGEILMFQNLSEVSVNKCESLIYVFPAYVARSLNQLKELSIEDCGVETIIGDENCKESTEQVATTFLFPKLAKLDLVNLPKLERFYRREYTIKWPALEELHMVECDHLSSFDLLSIPDSLSDKFIINVEYWNLRNKDMISILRQDGHFPPQLFRKLKCLITDFDDESKAYDHEWSAFLSKFLVRFIKQLETLQVWKCSLQEVFPYEGVSDLADEVLPFQLTRLELHGLPELKYICKQESSPFIPILDKLVYLQVRECPLLTNLVPFPASFRLLKYLIVKDCGGLINLIQSSTVGSLEQLEVLSISECQMLKEVIEGVGDDASIKDDGVILGRLRTLELEDLPRLSSFCSSSNYTFHFPLLEDVTVRQCPNMKTFCGGITTPKLNSVYLNNSWGEERWNGDLNATIQQLYSEMEVQRLTLTLPSTSRNNHFEAVAQIHEIGIDELGNETEICEIAKNANEPTKGCESLEEVVEGAKEVDYWIESTRPVKVIDACEKGKGIKFDISEGAKELAWFLASPYAVASSSQVSAPTSNPIEEVERLATTLPSTSLSNHFEAQAQAHVSSAEALTEPRMENQICKNATEPREEVETYEEVVEKGKEGDNCVEALKPGKVAEVCEKCKGKELEVCEEAMKHLEKSKETPRHSDTSSHNYIAQEQIFERSQLSPPTTNPPEEFLRLTIALPSSSWNSQFEPEAGISEKSAEELPTMEDQICKNGIDELVNKAEISMEVPEPREGTGNICEEVSGEFVKHIENLEEASCHSDPYTHKCTAQEQTIAGSLASQDVVASSSHLSSLISNLPENVQEMTTKIPSASSNNDHLEADAQFHEKAIENLTESRKQGQICEEDIDKLRNKAQLCENATEPKEGTEIGEEVMKGVKESHICVKVIQPEKVLEPLDSKDVVASSSQLSSSTSNPLEISHSIVTEAGTIVAEDSIPFLGELIHNLETQPVNSFSAAQVQYMEEGVKWFCPYVEKARKCLERNNAISEQKRKIAEAEALLRALEDENETTASSVPRFGKSLQE